MTIIEFFDENAIHNAFSTLLFCPTRLILIGTNLRQMHVFRGHLTKVLRMRKMTVEIQIVAIDRGNYDNISEKLSSIVTRHPDSVFDVSGGAPQYLVAAGVLSNQHGIPMHTADPVRGTFSILSGSGYPKGTRVQLSVQEMITLYGGKVYGSFAPSPHDTAFWQGVLSAWKVCRKNCIAWNAAIRAMHADFTSVGELQLVAKTEELKRKLSPAKFSGLQKFMRDLAHAGLAQYRLDPHGEIHFTYKNQTAKMLLAKEGNVLEHYTYYAALNPTGAPLFQDAAVGVMIDWQTNTERRPVDNVTNEIDVLLTHGAVPVFISCKNGFTDTDELYKLSVVSARFGGTDAKKVLVLSRFMADDSFLERARNLGIHVLAHTANLSFRAFSDKLRNVLFH